ncbi:prepilin-type N-terminal cleavage/methylation domain-containing protein [Bacillus sp. HNG]|uniref:competence type IV pilus major pilin ComGC n=1 Tax=Bacillus sp. HNG TaxID=2293325 RepID=UPI000E2F2491|nr:competence type IV pilus major pilin ComGC [Bacillus sp. HNG]RFB10561.1 prepilin-type N-terminal cleavage/methylation domain-containing protein [Bacillus sp. HNG]
MKLKNQKGFTLVEMLVVLLVVSILLLITVPNVTKHNSVIKNKGCEAMVKMVEAQVQAYEMEEGNGPLTSLDQLVDGKYLNKAPVCPNGDDIYLDSNGKIDHKEPTAG